MNSDWLLEVSLINGTAVAVAGAVTVEVVSDFRSGKTTDFGGSVAVDEVVVVKVDESKLAVVFGGCDKPVKFENGFDIAEKLVVEEKAGNDGVDEGSSNLSLVLKKIYISGLTFTLRLGFKNIHLLTV